MLLHLENYDDKLEKATSREEEMFGGLKVQLPKLKRNLRFLK